MLENCKIILVQTSHPGNIGASARAMQTMGVTQLALVAPKATVGEVAYARASGAVAVLDNIIKYDTLTAALNNCHVSIACTARNRSLALIETTPRDIANIISKEYIKNNKQYNYGVVFGPEHSGLTNTDLALCQYQLQIPANNNYSSLNLAAAVQIICYELKIANDLINNNYINKKNNYNYWANHAQLELFFEHLERTLINIKFLDINNPRFLMRKLRRLYNRTKLTINELNILRGILAKTNKIMELKDGS